MAITVELVCQPAHAQEFAQETFPPASADVIVWSARACYAEATWSFSDCTALLHVIRKRSQRANWTFLKMLKQYSVVNWLKSPRGRLAAHFKLDNNKNQTDKWNENWRALVQHVTAVFADTVTDPCPRADHWAAASFVPRVPMRRVRCSEKVENAFWVAIPVRG